MNFVDKAREGFEGSFAEGAFYNRQTQDSDHLALILNTMDLKSGDKVLDLGTGSGYLAFAIAEAFPEVEVIGLDIVEATLKRNDEEAQVRGMSNLHFTPYDGILFPFEDGQFDWVVTRYALHHFPDIAGSFKEMARVLKSEGKVFVSDPTPDLRDKNRFVDQYMQLKDDGHHKFYTQSEFYELGRNAGFALCCCQETTIRFPRKVDKTYWKLLDSTEQAIKEIYEIALIGNECFITEKVLNLVFEKTDL